MNFGGQPQTPGRVDPAPLGDPQAFGTGDPAPLRYPKPPTREPLGRGAGGFLFLLWGFVVAWAGRAMRGVEAWRGGGAGLVVWGAALAVAAPGAGRWAEA